MQEQILKLYKVTLALRPFNQPIKGNYKSSLMLHLTLTTPNNLNRFVHLSILTKTFIFLGKSLKYVLNE
jgi:hypothetical protein